MQIAAIIIRRPGGKFFVHQRTSQRKTYPNLYGLGAGGKVEENETPLAAAKRELMEEAGVAGEPVHLFSFNFSTGPQQQEMHIFELATHAEITPDAREWQWSGWMTGQEVDVLLQEEKLCPDTAIFYRRYIEEVTAAGESI